MSSIVRKGQQFAPKIRKNVPRRKVPTPASSQDVPPTQKVVEPLTPEPSQVSFYNKKSTKTTDDDGDVDPKDATKKVESVTYEHYDDEEVSDDDIVEQMDAERRKSLRLGSLSSTRSRRNSHYSRASFSENDKSVPIPIDVALKNKRRKSSFRANTKRVSIGEATTIEEPRPVPIETAIVEEAKDDEDDEEADISSQLTVLRDDLYQQGKHIIYALNPKLKNPKLTKYRTGPLVEGDLQEGDALPKLAPEEVVLKISSIKQIPRKLKSEPISLLSDILIDIDSMSMKDLCAPNLPIGSISANYKLVQQAKEKEDEERLVRTSARLIARTDRISYEEAFPTSESIQATARRLDMKHKELMARLNLKIEEHKGLLTYEGALLAIKGEEDLPVEEVQAKKEADVKVEEAAPRKASNTLKLQLDGKVIGIDTESTVIPRSFIGGEERTIEETNPFEKPVISNTYSKRRHTDKWTQDEEMEFYHALSRWGTDFSLISDFFPYRTRKQVKAKFNIEEKKRPELIDMALSRVFRSTLDAYTERSKRPIKSLEEFEELRKQIKIQNDIQKKEILKERERAQKEDAEKNKIKEIERKSGQRPMERLTRTKQLRANEEVVGVILKP